MNNNVINEVKEYFIDNKKIEIKEILSYKFGHKKLLSLHPFQENTLKLEDLLLMGLK